MSEPKYYTLKFTNKQMGSYAQAIHCLRILSETSTFYNSIRNSVPGLIGTNDDIKRDVLDPIFQSLGKLKVPAKKSNTDGSPTKRITNFNRLIEIHGIIQEIYNYVASHEDSSEYIVQEPNLTNSSKVRKMLRRYFILSGSYQGETCYIDNTILQHIPKEVIESMESTQKIQRDEQGRYFIADKDINTCLVKISIALCKS